VFRHEGPSRSVRKNTVLAAYLACVAGFVNAGGFLIIGTFTSHVTGSLGRFGTDIATHQATAAALALWLVVSFFLGAFVASVVLSLDFEDKSTAYGVALLLEALAIASFVAVAGHYRDIGPRARDLQAAILCAAMGMQNSLVTRLSGAVVRTTHLTGVITDLGIEAARWVRWVRVRTQRPEAPARASSFMRPELGRAALLLTITSSFVLGSILGASLIVNTRGEPMLIPALAVLAAALYAFTSPKPAAR
jgi:uncharacterized membrane protein YoaK (UPF0700 family)